MNVGGFRRFNWLPMQPAWKEMEVRRARRAQMLQQDQANLEAMNSAMATAQQNRITQSANISANAALKRVQAAAKAKADEMTKQIDDAQRLLDKTTSSSNAASSSSTSSGNSTVLDTVA
jgi:regulator of protease activity HflC (stomatin/prohibitin superfamily)